MKSRFSTALTAGLLGLAVAGAAPLSTGEARLAQALHGRTAGKPLHCLNLRYARSSRVIDGTAVIFESGRTLYVNRPLSGAESLSQSNALLIKSLTGEICRGEGVRLFDNGSRIDAGVIFLGEFVPYRKASESWRPATSGGGISTY